MKVRIKSIKGLYILFDILILISLYVYVCILEEVMEYIKLFISADKVGPSKYLIFEIQADF